MFPCHVIHPVTGVSRWPDDGTSGFHGLQNGYDLVFGESGFAHGDLLQGYIQYAGRSLNVNGPVYRDAYRLTQIDFC